MNLSRSGREPVASGKEFKPPPLGVGDSHTGCGVSAVEGHISGIGLSGAPEWRDLEGIGPEKFAKDSQFSRQSYGGGGGCGSNDCFCAGNWVKSYSGVVRRGERVRGGECGKRVGSCAARLG